MAHRGPKKYFFTLVHFPFKKRLFSMKKEPRLTLKTRLSEPYSTYATILLRDLDLNNSQLLRHAIKVLYDQQKGEKHLESGIEKAIQPVHEKLDKLTAAVQKLTQGGVKDPAKKGSQHPLPTGSSGDVPADLQRIIAEFKAGNQTAAAGFEGEESIPSATINAVQYEWLSTAQYQVWCRMNGHPVNLTVNFAIRGRLEPLGINAFTGRK